jgi:RecA-family ATPase
MNSPAEGFAAHTVQPLPPEQLYLEQLTTMGITQDEALALGMSLSLPAETKLATNWDVAALRLSIFGKDGNPVWSQYRFLTDVTVNGKSIRYMSAKNGTTRLDFSPNVDWNVKHDTILIAEGVKKGRAAILADPTLPVITVSSCQTWRKTGTDELHSDFDGIDFNGVTVLQALDFDTDGTTGKQKWQIAQQETKFANQLAKRGANVQLFRPLALSDSVYKLDDLLQSGVSLSAVLESFVPHVQPYNKKSSAASLVLANAPTDFKFVVDKLFPVDVGLLTATGGVGKTTFVLNAAIDFVLNRPIAGHEVLERGKVLFITGEDNHEIYGIRLRNMIAAKELTEAEIQTVGDSIFVEDFSSQNRPFVRDDRGNLQFTNEAEQLIECYQDAGIKWVIIDPYISFSAPEHYVNDGAQKFITCCRKIVKAFQCFCLIVHHESKVAADEEISLHNSRGGSALPDGSRFVAGLRNHTKHKKGMPLSIDPHDFVDGFSVTEFKVVKLSTAALPAQSFWFSRKGYRYEHLPNEVDVSAEEMQRREEETLQRQRDTQSKRLASVLAYLNAQPDEYNTVRSVSDAWKDIAELHFLTANENLKKTEIGQVVNLAIKSGDLSLVDPQVKKKGVKQVLHWDRPKF